MEKQTAQTQGPWDYTYDGSSGWSIGSAEDPQVDPVATIHDRNDNRARANARLIAAAPDLLDACRAFVTAYEKSLQLEKTDVALRLARAAIAKAEGRELRLIGDLLTGMGL